jgi:hypothetical protein
VADPNTGAWVADPYNQLAANPFVLVGGTSLSAPSWAGLLALVNQGRVAAGASTLNSSSPTDTQQALYMLPQSDYHVISSGYNGYTANPGYNLVTGLGTPVADLLVPDLIAYQGPGTSYPGPTVGPLQDATLGPLGPNPGSPPPNVMAGGPHNAMRVFDFFTLTSDGLGSGTDPGVRGNLSLPMDPAQGAAQRTVPAPNFNPGQAAGSLSAPGVALALNPGPNSTSVNFVSLPWAGLTNPLAGRDGTSGNAPWLAQVSTNLITQSNPPRQPARSSAQPVGDSRTGSEPSIVIQGIDWDSERGLGPAGPHSSPVLLDSLLDELASDPVRMLVPTRGPRATGPPLLDELASELAVMRGREEAGTTGVPGLASNEFNDSRAGQSETRPDDHQITPISTDRVPQPAAPRPSADPEVQWADLVVAVGFCGYSAALLTARKQRDRSRHHERGLFRFRP